LGLKIGSGFCTAIKITKSFELTNCVTFHLESNFLPVDKSRPTRMIFSFNTAVFFTTLNMGCQINGGRNFNIKSLLKKNFEVVNNVTRTMMIDRAGFLSLCQGLIFIINYKNNLLMFS